MLNYVLYTRHSILKDLQIMKGCLLNTVLRESVTLISSMKELAADDPGEVVHSLDHGLVGVDLKHETPHSDTMAGSSGYIIVEQPGDECKGRLEVFSLQSHIVEQRGAELRPGTVRHLLGRHCPSAQTGDAGRGG